MSRELRRRKNDGKHKDDRRHWIVVARLRVVRLAEDERRHHCQEEKTEGTDERCAGTLGQFSPLLAVRPWEWRPDHSGLLQQQVAAPLSYCRHCNEQVPALRSV
jgi:hypothetical protein